ncbi:hypothetical protein ACJ41O_009373 [Fusarium nematophilum]
MAPPSAAPAVPSLPAAAPAPPVNQPAATHTSGAAQAPPAPAAPAPAAAAAPANPAASPPPPPPRNTRPCTMCHNHVAKKSYADHLKVHRLLASGAVANWPCDCCQRKGVQCAVARNPGPRGANTFSCASCLQNHGRCSHTSKARPIREVVLASGTHPALATPGEDPWVLLEKRAAQLDAQARAAAQPV